jgi:hypothetical protein
MPQLAWTSDQPGVSLSCICARGDAREINIVQKIGRPSKRAHGRRKSLFYTRSSLRLTFNRIMHWHDMKLTCQGLSLPWLYGAANFPQQVNMAANPPIPEGWKLQHAQCAGLIAKSWGSKKKASMLGKSEYVSVKTLLKNCSVH